MMNNSERAVSENVRVLEDNFNSLSQIINNYPVTSYTEVNNEQNETDSSYNNSQEPEVKKPMTLAFKYYLLSFFSCIYLFYGIFNSYLGPALSDLVRQMHTDSEHISYAWSFRNITFCISTILVSFLFKFFGNRQMQYGLAVLVLGLSCGFVPFMNSFKQFLAAYFFAGFGAAFVDSVTNLVVLEIFSSNSKIYMQLAHAAYTVGTIFGPLIIGPFLSKDNYTIPSNENLLNNSESLNLSYNLSYVNEITQDSNNEFKSNIKIPYLIASVLLILSSITFMISQSIYPYVPEKRKLVAKNKVRKQADNSDLFTDEPTNNEDSVSSQESKPKSETVCQQINLPKSYYLIFLGLTGLLISIYSCVDGTSGMFMPSYLSKGELKIDKKDAAFMASVLSVSMAGGRFVTVLLAFKLTCKNMLFFNSSLILIGYIILTFFARHSRFLTWVTMFILGFGYSSTYPLILSFIENRIIITNTVQLYLLFSSCIFQMFVPIIIGHFIDTIPAIFTYINLSLSTVIFILLLFIHLVDVWKKKLIKKIKEDQENLVEN